MHGQLRRSILGEALFNPLGAGRFRAFRAASHPTGRVNPFAIEQGKALGYPTENLRSKSWDKSARGLCAHAQADAAGVVPFLELPLKTLGRLAQGAKMRAIGMEAL